MDSLVLGASGNLGRALCLHLLDRQEKVAGTYLSFEPLLDDVQLVQADVSSDQLFDFVMRFKPAKVYHLAWSTNLDECESNPDLAYGPARIGLDSLLRACSETGSHLIFMSSDGIFGDPECERYEDSPPCPINQYGIGKVEAEDKIKGSGIDWTILRACPVGYNISRERGLVNWILKSFKEGKTITGYADSSFTPLSVTTLARELSIIGSGDMKQTLHFLSDPPITKYDFLVETARILRVSDKRITKGSLEEADFVAPRPKRQDLQTRDAARRTFAIDREIQLSLGI